MKFPTFILMAIILLCAKLDAQHLNVHLGIEFHLSANSIPLSGDFDIDAEIKNVTNNTLNGNIHLDYYVGTTIPPQFYNNPTFSDTLSTSGPIDPNDILGYEVDDILATDPLFNLQANKQNIIIIWPRLGPGESGDSLQFFIDSIFVTGDSTLASNHQINEITPLDVYPNPVTEELINIDLTALPLEPHRLTVWNYIGQNVYESILDGGQINQIQTGPLKNGVFVLNLYDSSGIIIRQKKILLQSTRP